MATMMLSATANTQIAKLMLSPTPYKRSHCRALTCKITSNSNSIISRNLQPHLHTQGSLFLMAKKATMEDEEDMSRGKLLERGVVYQQNFFIKSYEINSDGKATMSAILNQLQELALNHFQSCGLTVEGFGSTKEMAKRNLIWVVHKLHVEVDRYPSWADIVQVNTSICASEKNSMRRDWVVRDRKTGEVLVQAVCWYVLMNLKTRRLSKFIDQIRAEINPFFMGVCNPIIEEDNTIIQKLDVDSTYHICCGILWTDLEVNQHVNHVNYINWIIKSVPRSVINDHWLSKLTLEYRKECGINNILQSLSTVIPSQSEERRIELHHSIYIEHGSELIRGRTIWRPKPK